MRTTETNVQHSHQHILKNELSNYNNSLRNVRDVLLDNETYKDCPLYKKLQQDIESYIMTLQQQ